MMRHLFGLLICLLVSLPAQAQADDPALLDAVRREIDALKPGPPPLDALFVGWPQAPVDEEHQPPLEPVNGNQAPHVFEAPKVSPYPATTPSPLADRSFAMILLVAGAVGWLLLAAAFLVLVIRHAFKGPRTE